MAEDWEAGGAIREVCRGYEYAPRGALIQLSIGGWPVSPCADWQGSRTDPPPDARAPGRHRALSRRPRPHSGVVRADSSRSAREPRLRASAAYGSKGPEGRPSIP